MTQKASNHGSKLSLRLFSLRPFVRNRQICLRAFPQDANESTKKFDLMCFAEEKFYHWTNQSRLDASVKCIYNLIIFFNSIQTIHTSVL